MNIGANIRKIRELKNYKQEYMATRLSIAQKTYSLIENDKINLSFSRLAEISQILEVSITDIINLEEFPSFAVTAKKPEVHSSSGSQHNLEDLKKEISAMLAEIKEIHSSLKLLNL